MKPQPAAKPLRNRALFEQYKAHRELSYSELADMFPPLTRQRVYQIIKREKEKNV